MQVEFLRPQQFANGDAADFVPHRGQFRRRHAQGITQTCRCEVGKNPPDGTCRNPGRADDGRDAAVADQAGFSGSQQAALPLVQMR